MERCHHAQTETSVEATQLEYIHHQCIVHSINNLSALLGRPLCILRVPISVMTQEPRGVLPLSKYAQLPSFATQVYKSYKSELTEHLLDRASSK